jgi:hypothetical protein
MEAKSLALLTAEPGILRPVISKGQVLTIIVVNY